MLIIDKVEVFGLDRFDDSAVVVKGRLKTLPIKQWEVGREFNRRIKQRFDALDIEIPFPHRTLYFGIDKEGGAPSAHLQMESVLAPAVTAPPRQNPEPEVQPAKVAKDKDGSQLPGKDPDNSLS
jgi:small conductance mechanosensitive channel